MNGMNWPMVPHTVLVAWEIYIQYSVPAVFAFFLRLKLQKIGKRHERKRLGKKTAVRTTAFESTPWWIAPEMRK